MKELSKNHPLMIYLDGLDGLTDGRGFGAEHLKAKQLLVTAPEMLEAIEYFDAQLPTTISGQLCVTMEMLGAIARLKTVIKLARGK